MNAHSQTLTLRGSLALDGGGELTRVELDGMNIDSSGAQAIPFVNAVLGVDEADEAADAEEAVEHVFVGLVPQPGSNC